MEFIKRTWAEIDLDALTYNIEQIKNKIPENQKIMGILKGDAYGHGDGFIGRKLQDAGFSWFGVSNIEEGMSLREEKITTPILVLGYSPIEFTHCLQKYDLTQCVMGLDYGKMLQKQGELLNCIFKVHIKLDTGMSRIGFQCDDDFFEQSLKEITEISNMKNLEITGIFTHYAVADSFSDEDKKFTNLQLNRFQKMVNTLKERGIEVGITHSSNSASTISGINEKESELDMCRVGIITYGLLPSKECEGLISLKPLMTLKTNIGFIKNVKSGTSISYGLTYATDKDCVIATIPIGYADGYSRKMSNNGYMLVGGKLAPIVGRICMDQMMLDITHIKDVEIGDEVVVFGSQKGVDLPVEELANSLGTINYEITSIITKRVPRVYYENQEIIGIVDHIIRRYK